MEAISAKAETSRTSKDYSSRPGALAWCFRKSRDRWKQKYQELKVSVKAYKNRVADLTKSRDQWRGKADEAASQLVALECELAKLRAEAATALKKGAVDLPAPLIKPAEQAPARGQQYPLGVVRWYLSLVLVCHASLRCAANVLRMFGAEFGCDAMAPDRSTGRLWVLRVGLWGLIRPKMIADDWVWMVDHSIQIGQCKCLVILGFRLSQHPPGRPLCHADMELIALVPMTQSNKETVAACLKDATARTGVPRVIVDDHGADLHGGVEIYRGEHPQTIEVYDAKHKAACLLRAHLEKEEESWKGYATRLGQVKLALQQTEMAFLVPPSQRTKSRFMNLAELVSWGQRLLGLVDRPSLLEKQGISAERVQAKLGWLVEYRQALKRWSAYHEQIAATLEFVRDRGLYVGADADLKAALPVATGEALELQNELIQFVRQESSKAEMGEWLPGSTEVVESCFGKLKGIESDQSKSGFTGLVLSLGAMVSTWTSEMIGEALEHCRVRDVADWCRRSLGPTIQSRRAQAFQLLGSATKTG